MKRICIGLVGDFNEKLHTHKALNESIDHCRNHLDFELEARWISTLVIEGFIAEKNTFHGFWIAPGSPYLNDKAVYETIKWAREFNFPLFGSCGGFQYMVVDYARNVLGYSEASHAETDPEAAHLVISQLSCSLKGRTEEVLIPDHDSWLYKTLKSEKITGNFFCSYGVNRARQPVLDQTPFSFTAFSQEGDARALELKGHRFFNGTLFQPSLDSSPENPNPLILDFFRRCAD
jgi:CTP synthase (UTP-ammonia lyase)